VNELGENNRRERMGMSSPPLTGRLPAQASRSIATGSSRPQALIQLCQRLIYELRLSTLVNLSWSAPQPAAGDLAVAQPTTVFINRLDRAPELPVIRRHATYRYQYYSTR